MKLIRFAKEAERTLKRLPANTAMLILSKIKQYAADPASLANNVKALKGWPGHLRLRIGDWRVIFTESGEIIAVIRIAPRGSVYD
jgi:mRNA interferase RelE/StbE